MDISKIIFSLLVLTTFFACDNSKKLAEYNDIADVATLHGNPNSNIVIVNTQGGPVTTLMDAELKQIMQMSQTTDVLYANVHQVQTKDPSSFNSDITFDAAKTHDIESVKMLQRVVDYFKKEKNKTVYVLGISFGAFMTQELIATAGIDVADKY